MLTAVTACATLCSGTEELGPRGEELGPAQT